MDKKLFSNLKKWFSTSLLSNALSFLIMGIWAPRLLTPKEYGIWLLIQLCITYSVIFNLGLFNGLNNQIPRLKGENNFKKVNQIERLGLGWLLVPFILCVLGVILVFMLPISHLLKNYLYIAFLIIFLQNVTIFFQVYFIANENFSNASILRLITGPLNYIIIFFMLIKFKVLGILFSFIITGFLAIIFFIFINKFKLRPLFIFKEHLTLVKDGFPIMLVGVLWSFFISSDRLIISSGLGNSSLGNYGLAITANTVLIVIPQIISQVYYPKISFSYGSKDFNEISRYLIYPTYFINLISPLMLGFMYFLIPLLVKNFLPNYEQGIGPLQYIIFGSFFLGLISLYSVYLNVISKQTSYLILIVVWLIFNAIVNSYSVFELHLGINYVALITAISYFGFGLSMTIFVLRDLKKNITINIYSILIKELSPFFVMILLILGINHLKINLIYSCLLFSLVYLLFILIILKSLLKSSSIGDYNE